MSTEIEEYIRYRMGRAEQAIRAARANLDLELHNDAVNRIYYACFYAVTALLVSQGYSSSKHSGVRSLFEKHFVKEGPISKEFGRFYHKLFDLRQESDYADFVVFEGSEVSRCLSDAEALIEEIASRLVDDHGGEHTA